MSLCGAKLTKVGIYGYGRFGSFLAKEMSRSFDVIVTDINMTNIDQKQESITYLLENEFFQTDFDIVVFANSINSFECVINNHVSE
jgi:glyceraldehyde-3-phosphate dehydrogenase/erythrose-4-phosphate dehydrogenase